MILVSATASLSGTASYAISSSYAINASGLWSSSSFTASAQSIAAFDTNGKPIFSTPTTNNTYVAIQDGAIVWIPITTAGGTGNFATYAEIFSDNEYLFVQSGSNFAFPSSSFTSDEDMVPVQIGANFAFPSSSFASDAYYSDSPYLDVTGSTAITRFDSAQLETIEIQTNISSSMESNQIVETFEYIDTVISVTSSLLPKFTARSYTTASV
jgi:hypothetical protein